LLESALKTSLSARLRAEYDSAVSSLDPLKRINPGAPELVHLLYRKNAAQKVGNENAALTKWKAERFSNWSGTFSSWTANLDLLLSQLGESYPAISRLRMKKEKILLNIDTRQSPALSLLLTSYSMAGLMSKVWGTEAAVIKIAAEMAKETQGEQQSKVYAVIPSTAQRQTPSSSSNGVGASPAFLAGLGPEKPDPMDLDEQQQHQKDKPVKVFWCNTCHNHGASENVVRSHNMAQCRFAQNKNITQKKNQQKTKGAGGKGTKVTKGAGKGTKGDRGKSSVKKGDHKKKKFFNNGKKGPKNGKGKGAGGG
jgi:hypothetical protein